MFLLNFLFPSCVNVCAYAHMEPRGQSWVLFLKSHLPRVVSKGTPEPVAHQPDLLVEFLFKSLLLGSKSGLPSCRGEACKHTKDDRGAQILTATQNRGQGKSRPGRGHVAQRFHYLL